MTETAAAPLLPTLSDIALLFCQDVLGWKDVEDVEWKNPYIRGEDAGFYIDSFYYTDLNHIETHVRAFLSDRFLIQINRGTASGWQYQVWIAPQNVGKEGPLGMKSVMAVHEDLRYAMLDACVQMAAILWGKSL